VQDVAKIIPQDSRCPTLKESVNTWA
jgi:hypothetical protein